MLALFALCALVPISALAVISFLQVRSNLKRQTITRLQGESEAYAMLAFERLQTLDQLLAGLVQDIRLLPDGSITGLDEAFIDRQRPRPPEVVLTGEGERELVALAVQMPDGSRVDLLDRPLSEELELNDWRQEHLDAARSIIQSYPEDAEPAVVLMARSMDPGRPDAPILIGSVFVNYLWRDDKQVLTEETVGTVIEQDGGFIYSSVPTRPTVTAENLAIMRAHKGEMNLRHPDAVHLAAYHTMHLNVDYRADSWVVILSTPRDYVLQPLSSFGYYFILVVAMAVWIALLLSIGQIRRSLIPLGRLQEGTRRIAEQDFATRVNIQSEDEFEELADSFNTMATQLGRQFNALLTIAEIDRAVLSSLDKEVILETVLSRTCEVVHAEAVVVAMFETASQQQPRAYCSFRGSSRRLDVGFDPLTEEEMAQLDDIEQAGIVPEDQPIPAYARAIVATGAHSLALVPIRLGSEIAGVMALGYADQERASDENLSQARQLADQFAVAISNARLVTELDEMNWGTINALARAIDAKSSWTAGHSERVTSLSLEVGRVMGLSESQLDTLHRGGLLHDLGKIGIPASILDKPDKLTDEEMERMREHTRVGVRILEPIPAYARVIPIVLQHHERYEGGGYPDGVAGEEIDILARTLAVADFFDALTSDRPYRPARDPEMVVGIIQEESGKQFDPKVVEAFLKVLETVEVEPGRLAIESK
jgi:putative nucleotidyltransferase with HDIG domain